MGTLLIACLLSNKCQKSHISAQWLADFTNIRRLSFYNLKSIDNSEAWLEFNSEEDQVQDRICMLQMLI